MLCDECGKEIDIWFKQAILIENTLGKDDIILSRSDLCLSCFLKTSEGEFYSERFDLEYHINKIKEEE